ncbi:carbamate kinase [Kineococcus sp. R86509]|uniref:carbamate kinase n=1 Tax=Kineococcus sp. R86509 TaxID=3093851 RepID=UPI0036D3DB21
MVAVGGNALLRRGERPDAAVQEAHVLAAAAALAPLCHEHEVLLCHGNGPQVGLLALESEEDTSLSGPYPLDALVAQTQGMIGYWFVQALANAGVVKPVVALVTQTVVNPGDPGFSRPTKFIGAGHPEALAREMAARRGFDIAQDGVVWRRVVASPEPQGIVEIDTISGLLTGGAVTICAGGGGAPVVRGTDGQVRGVEAVVDKDYVAAFLALAVNADRLLLLTDVAAVQRDYGTPTAEPIDRLDVSEVVALRLPAGSMGPKVEACRRFVQATGRPASIGALTDAGAVLSGAAGTKIERGLLPPDADHQGHRSVARVH